jgi:hypothetical protein
MSKRGFAPLSFSFPLSCVNPFPLTPPMIIGERGSEGDKVEKTGEEAGGELGGVCQKDAAQVCFLRGNRGKYLCGYVCE